MKLFIILSLFSLFGAVLGLPENSSSQGGPSPPGEPTYTYISPEFTVDEVGDCVNGERVWTYKPAVEKSGGADVVVYLHGYSVAYPSFYEGHIQHLVKQGNYVIFPQFQEGFCTPGEGHFLFGLKQLLGRASQVVWADRAARRVQETLMTLSSYNDVYIFGHSLGGAFGLAWGDIAPQMNVTAAVLPNPQPGGYSAIPGFVTTIFHFLFGEELDVPAAAPHTTFPVAVLHGNDDTIAPLTDVMPSYTVLGSSLKALYQAQTDTHGTPTLSADHITPNSNFILPNDVNSMDWRYVWPGLDQVMAGTPVTSLLFDMGTWSDGVAVLAVQRLD